MRKNKVIYFLVIGIMILSCCLFFACDKGESDNGSSDVFVDSQGLSFELVDNGRSYSVSSYTQKEDVVDINIPNTYKSKPITQIAANVFANKDISSVSLGENIKTIETEAFKNCKLTEIYFSDVIEEIKTSAFENSKIETLSFPESLVKIGDGAFKNCANLTEVSFSTLLESLGKESFYGTSITQVVIPENVSKLGKSCFGNNSQLNYTAISTQVLEESAITEAFDNDINLSSISVPSNYISAFEDFAIQSIEVVFGTAIPAGVMQNNDSLTTLTLCESITKIGTNAFSGCSNLVELSGDASAVSNAKISTIKILEITSGTKVPSGTFSSAPNLQKLSLCNSITSIGSGCFNNGIVENLSCSIDNLKFFNIESIKTLQITDGEKISSELFYDASELTNLTISSSVKEIEEDSFSYCTKLIYTEKDGNKYLDNWLVYVGNKNIEDLSTNENLMVVNNALAGCNSLSKLTINRLAEKLIDLFGGTVSPALKEITVINDDICDSAFENIASVEIININGARKIGDSAFKNCENLTNLNLSQNIELMADNSFYGCDKLEFEIYDNGKYISNILIGVDNTKCEVFSVREDTKFIYGEAFIGCDILNQVYIPISVTHIFNNAFYDCNPLLKLYIADSDGKALAKVNNKWNYYSEEDELTVYTNVKNFEHYMYVSNGNECLIMGYVFEANVIFIPEEINGMTVTEIAPYAFCGREDVEIVMMGNSIRIVGAYAFAYCVNMTSLILSQDLQYINQYAFYMCESLETVEFFESIVEIKNYAFTNCSNLSRVMYSENIKWFAQKGKEFIDLERFVSEEYLADCLKNAGDYSYKNEA